MRFSIIIPVYNVESYLRQCLDSVLAQTFGDWEAICVNDGSTDGSAAILEEYATKNERFKVITQANGGLSAARNAGIKDAQGEYVLFLDSDDWLEPTALQTLDTQLSRPLSPRGVVEDRGELFDMLCFSGRRFFEKANCFHPADELPEKTYATGMDYYNENALVPRDFAFVCVVLRAYRRPFLLENNLWFNEGIYHEDNLFTPIACYYAKQVLVTNVCLYNYRVRANSITATYSLKRLKDFMSIANELAAFFIPKADFDKTEVYRAITHHYQVVFLNITKESRKELKHLCDRNAYNTVSRTKLRHRFNYWRNRLCI